MGLESPRINATISGTTTATALTADDLEVDGTTLSVDADNNRVGIGTDSPDGPLHVMKASAGSVTASGDGNALVVESDDVSGVTLLAPDEGVIYFGDVADNDIGRIRYNHPTDSMRFWTNNAERVRIESDGKVGIGTDSPDGRLHVMKGSAGSVTASGDGNAFVIESDDVAGMTLLSPGDGVIYFGDAADNDEGRIVYKHSDNSMNLWTNNAVRLTIDSSKATFSGEIHCPGVSLTDGASINISSPPLSTADHTSTGLTAEMLAGGTIAAFQTVCIHTVTGEVVISDSDAIGTMPVIGIATEAIADEAAGTVLLQGFIRDDDWNWTVGGILYASGTAGAMTQTAPSGTGDFVQALGIALTADVVYFNPSLTLVEVA